MSFDVHITVVGICNFTTAAGRVHVTMPKDVGHHPHAARLYYDKAYQSAGSTEYKRVNFAHALEGKMVDVPAHTTELDPTLPKAILDGSADLKWGALKPGALNAKADAKAVVRLGCGGVSDYVSTRTFLLDGVEMRPANVVTWTIRGIFQSSFDFTITNGSAPQPVKLHPMRGCVRMFLVNVPPAELPDDGFHRFPSNDRGPLDHIDKYMTLFDAPRKVKVEDSDVPVVHWHEEGKPFVKAKGGDAKSLMTWVGACFTLRGQA